MIEFIWLGFKGALIIYSGIMFTFIGVSLLYYSGSRFVKLIHNLGENGNG